MNGTRFGHAFSSVRHALGNQKLLAWQQPETVLANDDRVFPLYYKHVFVELMPVSRTLPIPKAFPETRLTSIGAIENISLDVSPVLRFGSNLVGWIPHELRKVIHLSTNHSFRLPMLPRLVALAPALLILPSGR